MKRKLKKINLKELRRTLSEGVFMSMVALTVFLISIVVFVRGHRLPQFAEWLPAETSSAMAVLVLEDYWAGTPEPAPIFVELLGQSLSEQNWLGKHAAWAVVDGQSLAAYQIKSFNEAKGFLQDAAIDGELLEKENGIWCYSQSWPDCFLFKRGWLIKGSEQAIGQVKAARRNHLEKTASYRSIYGRLPLFSSAFFYVDLDLFRPQMASQFAELGLPWPRNYESWARLYPALGITAEFQADKWSLEQLLLVDKSLLSQKRYFRAQRKFEGNLSQWLPNGGIHLSGQNLKLQMESLSQILGDLNPGAKIVFESQLVRQWENLSGALLNLESLKPLFQKEYAFAWDPSEAFTLIFEVDAQDQPELQAVWDEVASQFSVLIPTETLPNGEEIGRVEQGQRQLSRFEGVPYERIESTSGTELSFVLWDKWAVLSNDKEAFLSTLEQIKSRQKNESDSKTEWLFEGADQHLQVDVNSFPNGHILKSLLSTFTRVRLSHKFFDDGIRTRYQLERL